MEKLEEKVQGWKPKVKPKGPEPKPMTDEWYKWKYSREYEKMTNGDINTVKDEVYSKTKGEGYAEKFYTSLDKLFGFILYLNKPPNYLKSKGLEVAGIEHKDLGNEYEVNVYYVRYSNVCMDGWYTGIIQGECLEEISYRIDKKTGDIKAINVLEEEIKKRQEEIRKEEEKERERERKEKGFPYEIPKLGK